MLIRRKGDISMPTRLKPLLLSALTLVLLPLSAQAVPIGTTPDTRPAAPQQRKQWNEITSS